MGRIHHPGDPTGGGESWETHRWLELEKNNYLVGIIWEHIYIYPWLMDVSWGFINQLIIHFNIDPGKPAAEVSQTYMTYSSKTTCPDPVLPSTLHTSHCTLHSSHSKLQTSHSTLHTSHSTLLTSHCFLHTPNLTLHTSHFTLRSSHSKLKLHTPHCTLHTPHFTLLTSHCFLHTSHFTLHSLRPTLHTALNLRGTKKH